MCVRREHIVLQEAIRHLCVRLATILMRPETTMWQIASSAHLGITAREEEVKNLMDLVKRDGTVLEAKMIPDHLGTIAR